MEKRGVHGDVCKREGMEASEPWEMAAMVRLIHMFDSPLMDFENAGEGKSESCRWNRIGKWD